MKRKIYEKQIVDTDTGELISLSTVSVSKFYETFLMARTTDALNWIYELTGNEIKTIIFFSDLEEIPKAEVKEVVLYPCKYTLLERKRLAEILKCTDRYLRRVIQGLIDKGWLIKLTESDYLLNPNGFYKGSSKEIVGRIRKYNDLLQSKKEVQRLTVNGVDQKSDRNGDYPSDLHG